MKTPNFVILYVDNPKMSAGFYAGLLGRQPVQESPTFALFALDSGPMMGLWSQHTVEPAPAASGGGADQPTERRLERLLGRARRQSVRTANLNQPEMSPDLAA